MVRELIAKEEEKILHKLSEYEKAKSEHGKLKGRELYLEEQIKHLQMNIQKPIPVQPQKFNLFQRMFSKKYKEHLRMQEEYKVKSEEAKREKDKIREMEKELEKVKIDIAKLEYFLKGIDIEELRQKLLDLKDEKRTVKLLLESDSELAENVEFMKEAIEIDETCIIFDKTNNPEIYIEVLEKNKNRNSMNPELNEMGKKVHIDEITRIQEEIAKPTEVQEGRYKIPVEYIFEAIREDIKSGEMLLLGTKKFLEYDGAFPKEFGEKMQEMWEDSENIFAVHGVSRNYNASDSTPNLDESIERSISSIFENGLRATNSSGELEGEKNNPALTKTAYCKGERGFSFITSLDYSYGGSYGYIIMQIPKKGLGKDADIGIWGTEAKDTSRIGKVFLLPKYIKGFVRNNKHVQREGYSIRENDCKDKTIYPYFLMDRSYKETGEVLSSEILTQIEDRGK